MLDAAIGSNYLTGTKDSDGNWLHGSNHYTLHVPANVPAKNFWSLTVYRIADRCFMHTEHKRSDRSSRHDLIYNEDGSVDVYIGPTAPEGKERNWIPTDPKESWFCWGIGEMGKRIWQPYLESPHVITARKFASGESRNW